MKTVESKLAWISPAKRAVLFTAFFMMLTGNFTFFEKVLQVYPVSEGNLPFLLSLFVLFGAVTAFLFNAVSHRGATVWVLACFLIASSAAGYFMDKYGTVIDREMLVNMLQTNVAEAGDLFNLNLLSRVLGLGILPAFLLWRFKPELRSHRQELASTAGVALMLVVLMGACILPFSSQYASFFREHKPLRYYANPTYFTYSVARLVSDQFKGLDAGPIAPIATDTTRAEPVVANANRELIVLVVGETARADRFSLNGYGRRTNPVLEKEEVVSFKNVTSCGTSTAVSVPCMFSNIKMDEFDTQKAARLENALDVLKREGVEVLWRDNNSDSKGVALRVNYEDYKTPVNNTVCDEECRDEGMLVGLDKYIDQNKDKDVLIVLHQMGSHGPAYYKRYPKEFERFTPVCKTNELSKCSKAEIDNAYDNAILYTDHFLGKVIQLLKKYDNSREAAMLYVSDHGESLGEYGMYLHGAPRAIAPKAQTEVASVAWFGRGFDYALSDLKPYAGKPLTHADLLCTLFLAFEMSSKECFGESVAPKISPKLDGR